MEKLLVGGLLVLICIGSIHAVFAMVSVREEEVLEGDGIERLNFQTTAADVEITQSLNDQINRQS